MPDESIRELERATALSPDDQGARVRLATALARAGRRRDALEQLDVLALQGTPPSEARALEGSLWREELSRLERRPAVRGAHDVSDQIAFDPGGRTLAWISNGATIHVADVASGEIAYSGPCLTRGIFVAGKRVFARDELRSMLVEVDVSGARPEVRTHPVGPLVKLLDVAPAGDRILLQTEQYEGVYEWPTLAPVVRRRCGVHESLVDWESGHMVSFELGGRAVEVCAIARGGAPGEVFELVGRKGELVPLGHGVVAQLSPGLTLHGLGRRWSATVIPGKGAFPKPSLARDGRGLRLVLGGTPVRFEVDLEKGAVVSSPAAIERLAATAGKAERWEPLWHPRADLAFLRGGSFFELKGTDGFTVRPLPADSYPHAWTRDGHELLVLRGAGGGGQTWLELWGARE